MSSTVWRHAMQKPKVVVIGAGSLFFGRQAIWQIRKGRVVTPHYHTARKLIALTEALH